MPCRHLGQSKVAGQSSCYLTHMVPDGACCEACEVAAVRDVDIFFLTCRIARIFVWHEPGGTFQAAFPASGKDWWWVIAPHEGYPRSVQHFGVVILVLWSAHFVWGMKSIHSSSDHVGYPYAMRYGKACCLWNCIFAPCVLSFWSCAIYCCGCLRILAGSMVAD